MELAKLISITTEEEEIISSIFELPQRLYRSYYMCIDRFEIYDEDEKTTEDSSTENPETIDNTKNKKEKKIHTSPPRKVYLLLHYVESKLSELYENDREFFDIISNIRGTIIEINSKKIVRQFYGRTISIVTDEIPQEGFVKDTLGVTHHFPVIQKISSTQELNVAEEENSSNNNSPAILIDVNSSVERKFYKYYTGVIVSVWYDDNRMFTSIPKKINIDNSYWSDSITFGEMFEPFRQVCQSTFTPENSQDVTHILIITNPSLCFGTRNPFVKDECVYVGSINNNTKKSFNLDIQDNEMNGRKITIHQELDPKVVDSYLKYGRNYEKYLSQLEGQKYEGQKYIPQWSEGESVIMKINGNPYSLVSTASNWRKKILDGKFNCYHIYCSMFDNNNDLIKVSFPYEELKEMTEKMVDGSLGKIFIDRNTPKHIDPFMIVLTNALFAVPLHLIPEMMNVYHRINDDIISTVDFLRRKTNEIKESFQKEEFFPGLYKTNNKTKLNQLGVVFKSDYMKCFSLKKIIFNKKINSFWYWPKEIKDKFLELKKKFNDCKDKNSKIASDILNEACIIKFVLEVDGSKFYTILQLKKKYESYMASKNKKTNM